MRRYPHRSLLRAVAPLIVAGTLTLAATAAAAGIAPATPNPLADSAFAPVTVPAPAAGSLTLPGEHPAIGARSFGALAALREPAPDILDALAGDQAGRPQPRVREPNAIVVEVAPRTTHVIRGPASWYCRAGVSPCTYTQPDVGGFDGYAAAGPKLRAAIGPSWRGTIVYVDGVRVKLIDWCQCYKGEPQEKLLDLYYDVYRRTGGSVTIRW